MSLIFPQNLVTFGAGKFSLGKNIRSFEEYIPLSKTTNVMKLYHNIAAKYGGQMLDTVWWMNVCF